MKPMFPNILVAVDGSESASKAFRRAVYLAQKCNSKLDLVHVVQCEVGGDSANTFEIIEQLKDRAKKMLEEYRIEAAKNNVPIQITIMQGDPAKVIIELGKAKSYDLIIMGTRGRSSFQELLIGSVSQKVMHHASCPVMVVR
ncbi:MAG: universal stress protein [Thaumarchaeota archaeon]|nr:MAG: universal stress protein [Nitrososphaerota archaeon]